MIESPDAFWNDLRWLMPTLYQVMSNQEFIDVFMPQTLIITHMQQ